MEIFTVVTGILYILLEIRQIKWMWIVGMLTSATSVVIFLDKGLYASSVLNMYYFIVSLMGLIQWKKDEQKMEDKTAKIHLSAMSAKVFMVSVSLSVVGSVGIFFLLRYLGDTMSLLDTIVAVCSAVATYWLCRSYIRHWYVWIAVNLLTGLMCLQQDLYLIALLYVGYSVSAVYGLFYWSRHGEYVD